MKFLAGVVVGIVIGRSVLSVANDYLTPPVRRKIVDVLRSFSVHMENISHKYEARADKYDEKVREYEARVDKYDGDGS